MRTFHVSNVSTMFHEELTEHTADAARMKVRGDLGQAYPALIRLVEVVRCSVRILLIVCVGDLEHFDQINARTFRRTHILCERAKEHRERAFQ